MDLPTDSDGSSESVREAVMEPNLQKGFEIVKGSLDDVLFVSRIGQKDWAGTEKVLTEFFVILPGVTVIKFRLLKTSPFTLLPKDIVDYILGDPRWQTNDSSKLYFRGGELAPDDNLIHWNWDAQSRPTFILAPNPVLGHSGKLWTCTNERCGKPAGNLIMLGGWTHKEAYQSHLPKQSVGTCQLLYSDLLMLPKGKRAWGKNTDYKGGNPSGCPPSQLSPAKRFRTVEVKKAETMPIGTVSRPARPADIVKQPKNLDSDSDNPDNPDNPDDSDNSNPDENDQDILNRLSEQASNERANRQKAHKPLPTFQSDEMIEMNRDQRRQTMEERLLGPSDLSVFVPNEADLAFERKHILAPSMCHKNRKFPMAQADLTHLRPESLAAMRNGELPAFKTDRDYVSLTYRNYESGARNLMTELQKYFQDRFPDGIHYQNFLDFGTLNLIKPFNLWRLLDEKLKNGNDKVHALAAYDLILSAQMNESLNAELSFASLIPKSEKDGLDPVQLQHKCAAQAEIFRNSVTNTKVAIKSEQPSGRFRKQQVLNKEKSAELKGKVAANKKAFDPTKILPKYFRHAEVQSREEILIMTANDKKIIPTKKQMGQFTNDVLVRLIVKNAARKESFQKMKRRHYMEAMRAGLQRGTYRLVEDKSAPDSPKRKPKKSRSSQGTEPRPSSSKGNEPKPSCSKGKQKQSRSSKKTESKSKAGAEGTEISFGEGTINLKPFDANQREYLEEVLHVPIEIESGKNAHKGKVHLVLSLPDVVLLEAYHAIALRYTKHNELRGSQGEEYWNDQKNGLDCRFFISPMGKQVAKVNFTFFGRITGSN